MAKKPPPQPQPPNLNAQQLLPERLAAIQQRLMQTHTQPDDFQATFDIVAKFGEIAVDQLNQQPFFQASETEPLIPFSPEQCVRCIDLFLEGVVYAAEKASARQIPSEIKSVLLQSLAQDVFLQSKQVIATTVGEHLTPDLQFPREQMAGWITQSADAALMYYINEYEKQHGPIEVEPGVGLAPDPLADGPDYTQDPALAAELAGQPTASAPQGHVAMAQPSVASSPPAGASRPRVTRAAAEAPAAGAPSALVPPPAPADPQTGVPYPSLRDKWAALALFLAMLPAEQKAMFWQQFGPDEQTSLLHLARPDVVTRECNVAAVTRHLLSLQQVLTQQFAQQSNRRQKALLSTLRWVYSQPPQRVLALAQQERPLVRRYLEVMVNASRKHQERWLAKAPALTADLREGIDAYLQSI